MSLTYDTPTASLIANGGLSETAAITLARLVCDTTVGADDLTSTNAQNNFVQELVAAVGPVIAFNAIGRQLDKIRLTVALSSAGTVYAPLKEGTYKDYLPSYLMRDTFSGIEANGTQTTSFSEQQFQTLAAFVNAGLPLATLLQVVDYHILMLFITKPVDVLAGTSGVSTLCSFLASHGASGAYAPASFYSKYKLTDNLALARNVYAISTLAQNGPSVVLDNSVHVDHIAAALLVDPVYVSVGSGATNADDDKIYGLLASLSTICSLTHSIRSSYSNLIKPYGYTLTINSGLTKNSRAVSTITLVRLSTYSGLISTTKHMWFSNTVGVALDTSAGLIISATIIAGTPYDPTQKQLITVSSLQGQTAQEIYTSLNFSSDNGGATSSNTTAVNEIKALRLYGRTIAQIRAIVDGSGYGIPAYHSLSHLRLGGFSNTEITNAFSGLGNGNYDFAVLIGVCEIKNSTTGNKLQYSPVSSAPSFDYVAADAIKSSIVGKLRSIVTAPSTDLIIALSTTNQTNSSSQLYTAIKDRFSSFASNINDANAEPAILRYLHYKSATESVTTDSATVTAYLAFNGIDNMHPFMNLKYTLDASPSKLAPTAFLKPIEFGAYTDKASELVYEVGATAGAATVGKVKSVAFANNGTNVPSRQYFIDSSKDATNYPSKQYYVLGKFDSSYFDNGFSFADAYPHMATSTETKIESIKSRSWPKLLAFTHTNMLLRDACADIMKKMNTNYPTPLSDDALYNNNPSTTWTSFTALLVGTQKGNSIDNIPYKTLINAGATGQYIKVDLAKNINVTDASGGAFGTTVDFSGNVMMGTQFAGFGLPFADTLYIARKVKSSPFTVKDIAANKAFSRFERRKIFENVEQAAQQLDKDTFLGLVWQPADLEASIKSLLNPLNIQLVDLLSLTYEAKEADADGYLNSSAATRLAYHDAVVRKNMVKIFYPNLPEADVAVVAALNNKDEILDELSSRGLI